MRLMDSDEINQRIIGLLTAVYTTVHEGGTPTDLQSLVLPLLDDMNLDPDTAGKLMPTFITAFAIVVRAYEKDCPEADILGLLQKLSLDLMPKSDS
jgi:hypothetical protein